MLGKNFKEFLHGAKKFSQKLLNRSLTLNLAEEQFLPFTFLFSWKQNNISIPNNVMDHSGPLGWRNAISIPSYKEEPSIFFKVEFLFVSSSRKMRRKKSLEGEKRLSRAFILLELLRWIMTNISFLQNYLGEIFRSALIPSCFPPPKKNFYHEKVEFTEEDSICMQRKRERSSVVLAFPSDGSFWKEKTTIPLCT